MATKTITWSVNVGGHTASSTSGRNFTISGTSIPSNAKISNIKLTACLSVQSPAGAKTNLYFLKASDGTVFINGNPAKTQNTSVWNNHDYYTGNDGVEYDFTTNSNWFLGKTSADLLIRVTNSGSGTSYLRGVQLIFTYTDFEPSLVKKGDKILASDYNQIRAALSSLTAMTAGSSKVGKTNIDSIIALDSDVIAPTVGTKITADYFNNSVLKKI